MTPTALATRPVSRGKQSMPSTPPKVGRDDGERPHSLHAQATGSDQPQYWPYDAHHYPEEGRALHHPTAVRPQGQPHPMQAVALAAAAATHSASLASPVATAAATASFVPMHYPGYAMQPMQHMHPYAAGGGYHWYGAHGSYAVAEQASHSSMPPPPRPPSRTSQKRPPPEQSSDARPTSRPRHSPQGSPDLRSSRHPSSLSSPPRKEQDTGSRESYLSLEAFRTLLLEDLPCNINPDVVLAALQKLIHHCRHTPSQIIEAIRMGAHSLLLVTWKRWLSQSHHQIVVESARFLFDMVRHSHCHVLCQSVIKMGAMDLIMESLQHYPESQDLHRHGLGILVKVLEQSSIATRSTNPLVADVQLQDADLVQQEMKSCLCLNNANISTDKPDLCGLVLNAMMRFEGHASIQLVGCILLSTFWDRCPPNMLDSVLKPRLLNMGAVMTISTAMDMHQGNEQLQTRGSDFLKLLAPRGPPQSLDRGIPV